jgi:hypothetical protein
MAGDTEYQRQSQIGGRGGGAGAIVGREERFGTRIDSARSDVHGSRAAVAPALD